MSKKTLYLIDGNAYVHRAYHALPPMMTSTGEAVNAVYGFTRMLTKILRQHNPDYIAVCFDFPAPTFRHGEFAEYKATRKETPDDLKGQFSLVKDIVSAMNIVYIEKQGYEADDIIATMAREARRENIDCVIVSQDKDVIQLVDNTTKVMNESKSILYDEKKVKESYGVVPDNIVDILAMVGDRSDNIPGVPGVGDKTARILIEQFGTLENILDNIAQLKPKLQEKFAHFREQALLSKKLVTLVDTVPLGVCIADCKSRVSRSHELLSLFKRFEFKSLISDVAGSAEKHDVSYNMITSRHDFLKLRDEMLHSDSISIDIETTSTDPLRAGIVGLSFSYKPFQAFYIPVGHSYDNVCEQLSEEFVLSELREVIESSDIKKYGQNIKYEILVLKNHGLVLKNRHFDSMVASYLLNPGKPNHNLEDIALEYLNERMTPITDLIGKGARQITMDQVSVEKVMPYACADADIVLRLNHVLLEKLKDRNLEDLFYNVEMPLVNVLAEMESSGILIDLEYVRQLHDDFQGKMNLLEEDIYRIAQEEFNINSPKQLSNIIFEKLKLPVLKKTKTGQSTQESVLKQLSQMHDLPARVLEYRTLQKLMSTYVGPISYLVNPDTSRVHTSFNQTVTATGRLSSSEPNLQNIPVKTELGKSIRRCFIPSQGYIFLSADYSQIDLRVLAHISGDENMCRAFHDNEDIHVCTASEIFSVEPDKVNEAQRRTAKIVNFGLSYGMSSYGLSQSLGIDTFLAGEYIDHYFKKYSGVKEYMEKVVHEARKNGFVKTLLNRRRYLPEINSKNKNIREFAERVAINMPIQGTASDIIKIAMIRITEKLHEGRFKTKMLLQIHDELLFEVNQDELEVIKIMVKHEMENAVQLDVPVIVNLSDGDNWRDLKE